MTYTPSIRIYRVAAIGGETYDFTQARTAGRFYRRQKGRAYASTWRVSKDRQTVYERLDRTGDVPGWAV